MPKQPLEQLEITGENNCARGNSHALKIDKILLPLDFIDLPLHLVHQAAALAHHFNSEIVLLHVVTPLSYPAGVFVDKHHKVARDLLAEMVTRARAKLDESLGKELKGLTIKRMLREGDPAREIIRAAQEERAKLVMIPTHGRGALGRLLLGSVTANVLHHCGCPVWTGAHLEDGISHEFKIRNILCAIDFGPHSASTVSWAVSLAAEFGSRLTLSHVIPRLEICGRGGKYVETDLKEMLAGAASQRMAKLSKDTGVKADAIIASGDVPKVLRRIAEQTKADLVVVGGRPSEGHIRASSYEIICESRVPVVSV
jgi:nucleotide-binding universal stress UspA family protein